MQAASAQTERRGRHHRRRTRSGRRERHERRRRQRRIAHKRFASRLVGRLRQRYAPSHPSCVPSIIQFIYVSSLCCGFTFVVHCRFCVVGHQNRSQIGRADETTPSESSKPNCNLRTECQHLRQQSILNDIFFARNLARSNSSNTRNRNEPRCLMRSSSCFIDSSSYGVGGAFGSRFVFARSRLLVATVADVG
jgi:hypothetical protein